jgi:hypothetical protein
MLDRKTMDQAAKNRSRLGVSGRRGERVVVRGVSTWSSERKIADPFFSTSFFLGVEIRVRNALCSFIHECIDS